MSTYAFAASLHVDDVIRVNDLDATVSHIQYATPKAGTVRITDTAARYFEFGAAERIQIVKFSS